MVDIALVVAVVLLVVGVVGSVVPLVPGGIVCLIGVYLYWVATGFSTPGLAFVLVATLVGLTAVAVDYLGGAISAKVGGASVWTTAAAAAVGLILVFVTGPVGVLVGVVGTVFVIELYRGAEAEESLRVAVVTAIGMLASNVAQVLLTGSILVGFLLVVFL